MYIISHHINLCYGRRVQRNNRRCECAFGRYVEGTSASATSRAAVTDWSTNTSAVSALDW